MANTTISPNMNLPIPTSDDPGPDYVTNNTACFNAIDSHNHAAGQGVPITPDGININAALAFNDNNATTARSVNFTAQSAPLALGTDIGCIYVSGKDLYYNDEDGNAVRITQGGSVTGSSGTITGLPSGTASASFAAGTFTFQSATSTPATMAVGPLVVGAAVASSKTVTQSPNASQPANYSINYPLALPASTALRNCDSSGQESYVLPDNSTFGLSGGVYKVLNGGIDSTQLANSSVGSSAIANGNVTNIKLALPNYFYSHSSATISSTSYTVIGSLSGSLTCVGGRLVMLNFTSEYSTNLSQISPNSGINVSLRFLRGATVIAQTNILINATSNYQPSWTVFDQSPANGANSYLIQAKVSAGSVTFDNCAIYGVEF